LFFTVIRAPTVRVVDRRKSAFVSRRRLDVAAARRETTQNAAFALTLRRVLQRHRHGAKKMRAAQKCTNAVQRETSRNLLLFY
jgi:hypothetical protein